MAPKAGKTKPHKPKGDKKKKEEKVLPTVVELTVETPEDSQVTLKGISTDRILDVRKLLGVHVETCHLTNFSLSHEVRGSKLKDSVDIISLKPCHLTIVQEDYTEELAVAHIRRLLDIVACTTSFGGSSNSPKSPPRITPKDIPSKESCLTDYEAALPSPEIGDKKVAAGSGGGAQNLRHGPKGLRNLDGSNDGSEKADGSISMCLPPRLGQFYEFFSFSYLTPPLQYIRRSSRPFLVDKTEDDFFQIDVRVCNGKPTTIVASRKGFYPAGKHLLLNHSLVGLLQQISRAFDAAYRALMKAFTDHNKFGNLPYGFRANTWVVPPVVAENPSAFPQLPVEDENWGFKSQFSVFHRSNPKSESNSFFHFFSIVRRRFGVVLFRSTVASSGSSGLSRRKPSASASSPSSVPTRIVYRERVPSSHSDLPFWQRNWFIALLFVMAIGFFALALFLFLGLDLDHGSPSSASAASSEGVEITYGSVLKLMHEKTKFRLHSHDVPYGSGSGQQSVTGFPNVDDSNSYWIVRPQPGTSAKQGDTIKSGTIIRLQHMRTRKWLHSHLHASPISGNLEVSCFGGDSDSDSGDYWRLMIEGSGKTWKQEQRVRLQHIDTGGYLHSHDKKYSRIAGGQQEVCGVREKRADNVWLAAEGVYLPVTETK